jgi:hypothetical protein
MKERRGLIFEISRVWRPEGDLMLGEFSTIDKNTMEG